LQLLLDTSWIENYPELKALCGVQQDSVWHPEGDVWVHTLYVCDAAAEIAEREQLDDFQRSVLLFSALCHDLGKPATTTMSDGRWRSPGHSEAGVPIAESFLARIGCPVSIVEVVLPLVAEHLVHIQGEASKRAVRRLACRLGKATIIQLSRLVEADMGGRPPLPKVTSAAMTEILELAKDMEVSLAKPEMLVQGRHLIALGYKPAKWFGDVLKNCYEAQLDGHFENEPEGLLFLAGQLRLIGLQDSFGTKE
jgi:tRNA nucleotidyltransferase (CCA-adding enzyme)